MTKKAKLKMLSSRKVKIETRSKTEKLAMSIYVWVVGDVFVGAMLSRYMQVLLMKLRCGPEVEEAWVTEVMEKMKVAVYEMVQMLGYVAGLTSRGEMVLAHAGETDLTRVQEEMLKKLEQLTREKEYGYVEVENAKDFFEVQDAAKSKMVAVERIRALHVAPEGGGAVTANEPDEAVVKANEPDAVHMLGDE